MGKKKGKSYRSVTSFKYLAMMARDVGQAEKRVRCLASYPVTDELRVRTEKEYELAKAVHETYKRLCLESDLILVEGL